MNQPDADHTFPDCVHEVDFLGGPLDGHREYFSLPLPNPVCFKSESTLKRTHWLARLTRLLCRDSSELFAGSIYELHEVSGQRVYVHTKFCIATEQKLLATLIERSEPLDHRPS